MHISTTIITFIFIAWGQSAPTLNPNGPIVDLGYGLWRATINETGNYYNFSNIRYARPPLGDLRFAAPQPPLKDHSIIHDGQDGRVCIQGYPQWSQERSLFTDAYLKGQGSVAAFTKTPPPGIVPGSKPPKQQDGRATEDCLFLDVLVPKSVHDNCTDRPAAGAPVMVWTHGGGFDQGSKESQGNPAGLLLQSMSSPSTSPGIVYVALNYRLAAFGLLAGPTFTASGGTPNAAILDQRLALEWVQKNIHLFGGDPSRVTLMGASSGASTGLHQITAYGGKKDAPFSQAFLQSPAFSPNPYPQLQETTYQMFLKHANATSLADLRAASTETIIAANSLSVFNSTYGANGGFGPVVDGNLIPQLPTLSLAQGKFAKNVKAVFSGHNTDEGFLFTNPAVQNTSAFNAQLAFTLPDASPSSLSYISETLYPPIFSNPTKYGYNDTISRLATLNADYLLNCNVHALLSAFSPHKSAPHAYLFEEGPSIHSEETPYMFFNNGPTPDAFGFGLVNATVAHTLQDWVLAFGATGSPVAEGTVPFEPYGKGREMGLLANRGVGGKVVDPAGRQRCEFWNRALYY